jgi:hypothetical protein
MYVAKLKTFSSRFAFTCSIIAPSDIETTEATRKMMEAMTIMNQGLMKSVLSMNSRYV